MKQFYLRFLVFTACSLLCSELFSQDLQPSQQPHLSGYWKFQDPNNLTKATVGKDLQLVGTHQWVPGPERKDTAVRIGIGSYYKCYHGAAPNGGDSVNRYTLMFDFRVDNLNLWHTLFQTDTNNLNDGECFIRPNTETNPGRIGTATTGYTPVAINPQQWYRLVISVDLGSYYRYYLNGQLILDGNNQDTDDRFSLNPYLLLFADNDQEDDTIDIASVAVFDTCLNSTQVAALGTVDPCILHPMSLDLGKDTSLCGNANLIKQLKKGYNYKWSTGDTASSLTFNVTKMGLGTKSVSVEMKDINACVKRDTFILSINSVPSVNLGKDTGFCKGPSYRLLAGPASGNTYEWKHLPSGIIVSKINSMTTDSSGIYTVRMTNSSQCSAYDTVQISVYPVPSKPVISYNSKVRCQGDTFFVIGPSGYAVYQWSDGYDKRNYVKTTDGSLMLKVATQYGCSSVWSDSVVFKYNPLPNAPQIKFIPDTNICSGDTVTLFVQGSFSSIFWNDGYNKGLRIVTTSGTFSAYIRDNNYCKSEWSAPLSTHVLNRPSAPVILSPDVTKFCEGDTAHLSSVSDADSIIWSTNQTDKEITLLTGGRIILKALNRKGCYSKVNDTLDIQFYKVPPKPFFDYVISSDSLYLMSRNVYEKYEWRTNGTVQPDSGQIFKMKKAFTATYGLRVRNEFCWSEVNDTLLIFTENISSQTYSSVSVYPNPLNHSGILNIDKSVDEIWNGLTLYNSSGQLIYSLNEVPDSLSLNDLPDGIYTLEITGENRRYRMKVVKL